MSEVKPLEMVDLNIRRNTAHFFKVYVELKECPLKMIFKTYHSQSYPMNDVEIYWSFDNQFPCAGEFESNGSLKIS